LADPASLGLDGEANDQNIGDKCSWEPPAPANLDDLDQGQVVQAMLERMRLARANPTPVPEITPASTESVELTDCPVGTTLFHVVSAGENLYRISLKYSTSVGAIMQANGLTDASLIYAGQRLTIPCGLDIGIPALPNAPTALPGTTVSGVDCTRFKATSPLDGFAYGTNTFYWDAAAGADGYRVNVYNVDEKGGALVNAFTTSGSNTNLTADITVESSGYGFLFAWDVQALLNGQVACTSARYSIPRAPQPAGVQASAFTVGWSCTSFATLKFDFANMPSGTTAVVITYNHSGAGFPTPTSGFRVAVPPDPGSATIFGGMSFTAFNGYITAVPSGVKVGLPGSLTC
jgi:LysM repeat protein